MDLYRHHLTTKEGVRGIVMSVPTKKMQGDFSPYISILIKKPEIELFG